MPKEFDPHSTSVDEVHTIICDTAVRHAHDLLTMANIPPKWKGPVFRNNVPYGGGNLSLVISEEYQGAPERIKKVYRRIAMESIRWAIAQHQDIFGGMIFGEARAGRNYFTRWEQAPLTLF